ncbi:MAG TPA: glucoamylase family protein, partial [Thermoanaerobaculia bacterium]
MSRARTTFAPEEPPPPIRGEIFSSERLESFAESLAASHAVFPGVRRGQPLLPRLRENGDFLLAAYRSIARAIREGRPISPAAEWLADNFHVVEEQVREILEDLPPAYHRELPKLEGGPLADYPRVYGLAWSFVEHTDSRFDPEALAGFVRGYQRVQPLTIGELWAVAILLRIVLVENLRRLVERIVGRQEQREKADALADRLLALSPGDTAGEPERRELERLPLSTAFAVQLVDRLRDRDPEVTAAVGWLNARLAAEGTTPDELVQAEHHEQVATHVTVRNVITSMRLLSSVDWKEFFERVSLVEEALREGTDVAAMDFATRDRYRHAVEELSRGSKISELEIARRAAARARRARRTGAADERLADPGHYLISKGRSEFEKELGFRATARRWLRRAYVAAAIPGYLATIALLTTGILAVPLLLTSAAGAPMPLLLLMAALALVPASDLAIAIVNRDVTELVGPRRLPKLELREGIPPELATLVAIPALLTNEAEIEELAERLEVHYLANPEPELTFALVTDWLDSSEEVSPEDEVLLAEAKEAIERLRARHPLEPGRGPRFFLLHRRRVWNPSEGIWMGWERKRGKLHELNRLLRAAADTSFLPAGGELPGNIRYVITLDADTRLGRRTARRLVGAIAHPLNRARLDARKERVVEGYGLLQPRVTPLLPATGDGTLYQRIFSGPPGIDPYAFAVSDVYQDLFGEGTYTGKGIYDVDAFETALDGRVPENALLSHDLFEGLFARAGLLSDVELFEGFPAHYEVSAARQHRWARGDWQLLPWVLGLGRDPRGRRRSGDISAIGRWKMLDNLRRSLVAPASLLALVAGWALPGDSPLIWTAFILSTLSLPPLFHVLAGLLPKRRGISKRSYVGGLARDLNVALWQAALQTSLLAHQAVLMTDAAVRTLWRLLRRRRLLEWVTAAQSQSGLDLKLSGFYRRMAPAVVLASVTLLFFSFARPDLYPIVLFFGGLWAASPALARAASLPPRTFEHEAIAIEDERVLRSVARRSWRYFEDLVGPEDNHLPPDNVQEDPRLVAYRTSPTNIGLSLLSAVSAHDLGWIGTIAFVERVEATLATLARMDRFRGHFYNWYDTRSLEPLEPRYVSTVDSGNLAGHLLTLSRACLEQVDEPVVSAHAFSGIRDTLAVARELLARIPEGRRGGTVSRRDIEKACAEIEALLPAIPETAAEWESRLAALSGHADAIVDMAEALAEERGDDDTAEVLAWCRAVRAAVVSHRRDFDALLGWTRGLVPESPRPADEGFAAAGLLSDAPPPLAAAPELYARAAHRLEGEDLVDARRELQHSRAAAADLIRRLTRIAQAAERMAREMDFRFLFDDRRKLFSIGYRLSDGRLDSGFYDLLASEARLASFIAIALGQVPAVHWFQLGRALTPVGTGSALVSWSGSMFEYLMPKLVMNEPSGSLLDQTARLVVGRQIRHGVERGIPWGVSESAYSARDIELVYQYSTFGLPGLGLKRGLSEDLVIAPYATALGAMVDPAAAARNFTRLSRLGAEGRYGFFEALDYTPERLPEGTKNAIVRAHMAHHQGMTIVALADVLEAGVMRSRFHSYPAVQATELLLQERTPRGVAVTRPRAEELRALRHVEDSAPPVLRRFESPHDVTPRTHLLSNGRYTLMITAAGSGYSRWRGLAVTRWREDVTQDLFGSYVFLRDAETGAVWSAAYQPAGVEADRYDVGYAEDHVEIHRRDGTIATTQNIVVSAEDDAEVRQVSISN